MRSPRPRFLLVAITASLILAGCTTSPVAPEPDDRSLVVYSGRDEELVGPLLDAFEAESGITIKVRYANSIEMAAQLLEEGDRTPAQVFLSQEPGALGALSAEGLLAELPDDILDTVDPQYSSTDGTWVGLTGRARVIAYDGEELTEDEVPTTVFDLTDPQWRGQVGIAPTNASFQSFVTALRVLEGEDTAEAWLRGLVANDVQIFPRNGAILEAVNTGVIDVGLINHYYWFQQAAEVGAQNMRAQLRYGEPGTASALVNVTGAGILTPSADNAEALEFVRYLLSVEGQDYFVSQTTEYSVIPGGPAPADAPALDDIRGPELDYADLADLDGTIALLEKVGLL
ncbi:iron ABC transporter substrate-binding protein [Pseudolysinimonas sp.]|uniref:iron ABC transporter substrate-binding protein n=1 Tax=Pseudolysinimonas sp. TaxID=2680009 RepID=UPI00286B8052|nr:iron ABC transporter substrate-binding protein [Pseudolysinimonas sp.]